MKVRGTFEIEFEVPDSDEGYKDHISSKEWVAGRVLPYSKVQFSIGCYNEGKFDLEELFMDCESVKLLALSSPRVSNESC